MAALTLSKLVTLDSATTTINQPSLTFTSNINVTPGAVLVHPNIPAGTTVQTINSATSVTMSANATASGSSLSVLAYNPDVINSDNISLGNGGWASADTLTIADGLTMEVTTDQYRFW